MILQPTNPPTDLTTHRPNHRPIDQQPHQQSTYRVTHPHLHGTNDVSPTENDRRTFPGFTSSRWWKYPLHQQPVVEVPASPAAGSGSTRFTSSRRWKCPLHHVPAKLWPPVFEWASFTQDQNCWGFSAGCGLRWAKINLDCARSVSFLMLGTIQGM